MRKKQHRAARFSSMDWMGQHKSAEVKQKAHSRSRCLKDLHSWTIWHICLDQDLQPSYPGKSELTRRQWYLWVEGMKM
jgi:hypothetical protein